MNGRLQKPTVLVLNRNWQAINVRTPEEVFGQMATDAATALDIDGKNMRPVKWEEWIRLPIRERDDSVLSSRGPIRIPTVIVLSNYAKMHTCRPKLSAKNIWLRDGGRCQYSGRLLQPHEGNIDHVWPLSKGGKTSWQNCVLAAREVNTQKADKTLAEAGLTLLRKPQEPKVIAACQLIRNTMHIKDWEVFLKK